MPLRLGPAEVAELGERRLQRLVIIAAVVLGIVGICVFTVTLFANSLGTGLF
jgi:hypothetical protein